MHFESSMKSRSSPQTSQLDLFQAQWEQLLNLNHPLCRLAKKVDWNRSESVLLFAIAPTSEHSAKPRVYWSDCMTWSWKSWYPAELLRCITVVQCR